MIRNADFWPVLACIALICGIAKSRLPVVFMRLLVQVLLVRSAAPACGVGSEYLVFVPCHFVVQSPSDFRLPTGLVCCSALCAVSLCFLRQVACLRYTVS